MSVLLGALAVGRKHAEARMTETVRIGTIVTDEEPDANFDPVRYFESAYSGPARLKFVTQTISERDAGTQQVALQISELHLPSGTEVFTDMFAVVDASTADPGLVGRVFRIKGLAHAGQTTAARYPVEESGEPIPEGS